MNISTKEQLYKICEAYLQKRLDAIEDRLQDISDSMGAETKSSVGDKYETGRAMLHLEKDKQMRQLATLVESKKLLSAVNPSVQLSKVERGALVKTNQGSFFISISAGKLLLDGNTYFSISLASPIGKLLFQKSEGEGFEFRGNKYIIESVV